MASQQKTANPAAITINGFADVDEVKIRRRNGTKGNTYYGHLEGSFDIYADDPVFTKIDDPELHSTNVLSVWNGAGSANQKPWQIANSYIFVGVAGGDGFQFADQSGNSQVIRDADTSLAIVVGGLVNMKWKGRDRIKKGDYFYWALKDRTDDQIILPQEKWQRIYAEYKIYTPSLTREVKAHMSELALNKREYSNIYMLKANKKELHPAEEGTLAIVNAIKRAFAFGAYMCKRVDMKSSPEDSYLTIVDDAKFDTVVNEFLFEKINYLKLPTRIENSRKTILDDLFAGILKVDMDRKSKIIGRAMGSGYTDDTIPVHMGQMSH